MGNKWPNHRIYIAMFWMIPTCIGYALLWKLPRSNQGGLLTAIYIVSPYASFDLVSDLLC